MARAKAQGNGRLEEAMEELRQSHAILAQATERARRMAEVAEAVRRRAAIERAMEERFARIEALLLEQHRLLDALPDAFLERLGFRPQNWRRRYFGSGSGLGPVISRAARLRVK
jgi:hypothetical protein